MQRRILFIISLIVIIALSWANVDYFGTARTNTFSPAVNQAVHIIAFMATGIIGYVNWRKEERWVYMLWLWLYIAALVIFLGSVATFTLTHSEIVKRIGVSIRNRFTEPLPFLVFYLFIQITKRLGRFSGKNPGDSRAS